MCAANADGTFHVGSQYSISPEICTRFLLCCGYTLTNFSISIRLTSLALWQSNDCPSASKATLMNMDKYFMWIHYERLHNHNKAKHNKTVCIFLGIYCIYRLWRGNVLFWLYMVQKVMASPDDIHFVYMELKHLLKKQTQWISCYMPCGYIGCSMAMETKYVAHNVVVEYFHTMFPYSYGLFFKSEQEIYGLFSALMFYVGSGILRHYCNAYRYCDAFVRLVLQIGQMNKKRCFVGQQ